MFLPRFHSILVSVALFGCLLAACTSAPAATEGSPASSQSGPIISTTESSGAVESQPLTSIKTSTPLPPQYLNGMRILTTADNGKSIRLAPGERFVLNLGAGYDWVIETAPESIVRLVADLPPAGAQGIYEAVAPGKAALIASGDPLCQSESPACMRPSIFFEIEIVVR